MADDKNSENLASLAYTRDGSDTEYAIRVYQLENGTYQERVGGTASWRHNNPGNLKFEYEHSADPTVKSTRTEAKAYEAAITQYPGAIGLDQRGNVIFDSMESGYKAQAKFIYDHRKDKSGNDQTVAQMIENNYSKKDYTGETHYKEQLDTIYKVGDSKGFDLRTKTISAMTEDERVVLAEGISQFESFKPGKINSLTIDQVLAYQAGSHRVEDAIPARRVGHAAQAGQSTILRQGMRSKAVYNAQDELHTLGYLSDTPDSRFGSITKGAVEAFQRAEGLPVDGKIGPNTQKALDGAMVGKQISDFAAGAPLLRDFSDPSHPQNSVYNALKDNLPPGTSEERLNQGVAACYQSGITSADKLTGITIGDKSVTFDTQSLLANPAHMDIGQPAPSVQQTMQQVRQFDQQQVQIRAQVQQANQQANLQQGPVMGGPQMGGR